MHLPCFLRLTDVLRIVSSWLYKYKKKIKDSKKSGAGHQDLYKPRLKWFNILDDALKLIYEINIKTQTNVVFTQCHRCADFLFMRILCRIFTRKALSPFSLSIFFWILSKFFHSSNISKCFQNLIKFLKIVSIFFIWQVFSKLCQSFFYHF